MKNLMTVATFDTLAAVRNLEKSGMGTSQAEAVTETIRIAIFQGVATKDDAARIRTEIVKSRAESKADTDQLAAATSDEFGKVRTEFGKVYAEFGKVHAAIARTRAESKADTDKLRLEMNDGLAKLRAEMKDGDATLRTGLETIRVEIEKLRSEQTWRMMLIVAGMLGIFTAIERLFPS